MVNSKVSALEMDYMFQILYSSLETHSILIHHSLDIALSFQQILVKVYLVQTFLEFISID